MATWDDYEPGHPVGFGETEQEAISELLEYTMEKYWEQSGARFG